MNTKIIFCFFALILPISSLAKPDDKIAELIRDDQKYLQSLYQDLHQYPELSGEEKVTAKKAAEEFHKLGMEVIEGIGGTGVVGVMKNGDGPVTLIRSELDGLPVTEETGLPYASKNAGKMHACGHDFHLSSVIGTARVLSRSKDQWKGTLVFVAQPAEESGNGALTMIKDGLFKKIPKPSALLALHTSGLYKKGQIGVSPGFVLANVDSVDVTFKGKGTHGSQPNKGIDPFIMAAEFTLKMQTLVGRERNPIRPAVISVGSIHGGTKHNIIPDEVKMQLTVRTYDADVREHLKKRIREVAVGIARASGAPDPVVGFPESADATYNDPVLAERVRSVFTERFGKEAVLSPDPVMGGEDFGQFGLAIKAPSVFFWIGAQDPRDISIMNHSAKYAPDFAKTAPLAIEAMSLAVMDLNKK